MTPTMHIYYVDLFGGIIELVHIGSCSVSQDFRIMHIPYSLNRPNIMRIVWMNITHFAITGLIDVCVQSRF